MLTIEKLIIHKVDQRQDEAPQLSDLASPLNDAVSKFVSGHILSNREHKNARTAVFNSPSEDETPFIDLADAILQEPSQFITASHDIAHRLFAAVENNRRISPSDLFICIFTESDVDGQQLALLKMEPVTSFAGDFERVNGKQRFALQPVDNVMPTGDLQKSTFILPAAEREERGYDLRLVDQQIARFGARRPVASFFTEQFLGCRVRLNDGDLTKGYVYGSNRWLKRAETKNEWTDLEKAVFKERIRTSLLDQVVDLAAVATQAIPDSDQQADYLDYMVEQELDQLSFTPDSDVRKRWADQVIYYGDAGLQVRINPEGIGPDGMLDAHFDPATGLWTVIITTGQWEEHQVS